MKKFVSMLLALVLLCTGMVFVAHAEEEAAPYSSNFFTGYGASLSRAGSGRILISFTATGTGVCTRIGVASYQVQKLGSDGSWDDVTGLLSGATATNTTSYSFSKYFNGVSGETYRVKVVFTCVINGDGETKNYTSGRITA